MSIPGFLGLLYLAKSVLAQDNSSYVNYNIVANPDLYPDTLETSRLSTPDCQTGPLSTTIVCNSSASPQERAAGLVKLFNLDELVNHTGNTIPAVPRLGLPNYEVWNECLHGLDHGNFSNEGDFSWSTSFPQPILSAASFNKSLWNEIGGIVSTQARAFNNYGRYGLDGYDPNINGFRSPIWGRGQETPGEDTYCLSSAYAYEYITGLQGGVNENEVLKFAATAKHFAGYDIDSWHGHSRLGNDVDIDQQALSEYYTPQFRVAVADAKVHSVMCSYNAVNGVPSCANGYLLQTLLRDTWGFPQDAYVTSDCDAVYNVFNPHGYASNITEAAAISLNAGTDSNCGQTFPWYFPEAVMEGLVNRSDIEQAVERLYSTLIRAGYFDSNQTEYRNLDWSDVEQTNSQGVSYEAAVQGTVLLKNDGVLPLSSDIKSIALIGPLANATSQMQGNYYGPAPFLKTYLSAFQASGLEVNYAFGTNISTPVTNGFADAEAAARKSDLVMYIGGIDNTIEAEAMDRENLTWPGEQLSLIHDLAKLGKPVVVVQSGGGQVDDSSLKNSSAINAIIWNGYPAQSGGPALYDIVSGKRAPAGRLVSTQYPANYVNQFDQLDMSLRPNDSSGNPGQTYAWYTGEPVYAFGHGLFYTTFEESCGMESASYNVQEVMGNSTCSKEKTPLITFTTQVHNTGSMTSDYTGLLFANTTNGGPGPYPSKWLVGFDRVSSIAPGQYKELSVEVPIAALARVNEKGDRVVYPGTYELALNNERSVVVAVEIVGQEETIYEFPAWEVEEKSAWSRIVSGWNCVVKVDVQLLGLFTISLMLTRIDGLPVRLLAASFVMHVTAKREPRAGRGRGQSSARRLAHCRDTCLLFRQAVTLDTDNNMIAQT